MKTYRPRHTSGIWCHSMDHPVHGWSWVYALECSCGRVGSSRLERADAEVA